MTTTNDGGPAFPQMTKDPWNHTHLKGGISLRDYLATHAPIYFFDAIGAFGTAMDMADTEQRAAFMAVWSHLRYEYADAMLAARQEGS